MQIRHDGIHEIYLNNIVMRKLISYSNHICKYRQYYTVQHNIFQLFEIYIV